MISRSSIDALERVEVGDVARDVWDGGDLGVVEQQP